MEADEKPFFPRGAIAFFVGLIAFYALFWLAMMGLLVARG
jgi:hypothetical protein